MRVDLGDEDAATTFEYTIMLLIVAVTIVALVATWSGVASGAQLISDEPVSGTRYVGLT